MEASLWSALPTILGSNVDHPRSESQIYDLNRMIVDMMVDVFLKVRSTANFLDENDAY